MTRLAARRGDEETFLDVVKELTKAPADGGLGLTKTEIPAKLEGIAFGEDVLVGDTMKHTLFIANDNDFLPIFDGQPNPNRFYVFAFDAGDLQAAFGDEAPPPWRWSRRSSRKRSNAQDQSCPHPRGAGTHHRKDRRCTVNTCSRDR